MKWLWALSLAGAVERKTIITSDGVKLTTRVVLPRRRSGERVPTVLMRNGYPAINAILRPRCAWLARNGYACVYQVVRGRGCSTGEWAPFSNEQADAHETLDWITAQPWSNGDVAMIGSSYLAAVQWAAIGHEALKTIIPAAFGTDLYRSAYTGGLFRHELLTAWMVLMPDRKQRYRALRYWKALNHRPRSEMDVVAHGKPVPWFQEMLAAQQPDDAPWSAGGRGAVRDSPGKTDIPVFLIAGWADAFLGPQLETWEALPDTSQSTLVVGPWAHIGSNNTSFGIRLPGVRDRARGLTNKLSQKKRTLDWLDRHLKGAEAAYPDARVLTYVVGGDRWEQRDAWPPPTAPERLYLGDGDVQAGLGSVSRAPVGAGRVGWTYDPRDPTPSFGGAGSLAGVLPGFRGVDPGFRDQRSRITKRDDVLGWVWPVSEKKHIAGRITATLNVVSDAPDTAFNVRISEKRPSGAVVTVREGILALSAREGDGPRVSYTPHESVTITIETWPIEYEFQAGSSILIQLASASFPRFEAHSNTTEPWHTVSQTRVAEQTVLLGDSHITLPVVREGPER